MQTTIGQSGGTTGLKVEMRFCREMLIQKMIFLLISQRIVWHHSRLEICRRKRGSMRAGSGQAANTFQQRVQCFSKRKNSSEKVDRGESIHHDTSILAVTF
jgi:hypothetical protein